eukprot:TRINITY_DN15535_c0_g1_i1.p1 TRINITY_DN15535_c0_g1~~TRINITY_DN15535_c0_g1_i1.p1  ORF type:complete len:698 (-),score=132.53 TRINITY_DN15535_c0_g1_i1:218-2311(-)
MAPRVDVEYGTVDCLSEDPKSWIRIKVGVPVTRDTLRDAVLSRLGASITSKIAVVVEQEPQIIYMGLEDLEDQDIERMAKIRLKVVKTAIPVAGTVSVYRSYTMLQKEYLTSKRYQKVEYLHKDSGIWCDDFAKVWQKNEKDLMAIKFRAAYCTTEKGTVKIKSYQSAENLLKSIFDVLMSCKESFPCAPQQKPVLQFFQDKSSQEDRTRPDVSCCLSEPGVTIQTENLYSHLAMAEELKPKLTPSRTLAAGECQCIDRATRALLAQPMVIQKLVIPTCVSDNRLLKGLLVITSRVKGEATRVMVTQNLLQLSNITPAADTEELPIDTAGVAYKELSYLVFVALKQYLEARAESTLPFPLAPAFKMSIRDDEGNLVYLEPTGVLAPLRYSGGVLTARGTDATPLVVKLGPAPALTHLGHALCVPAERFLQVQREASILSLLGSCRLIPKLLLAGTLEQPAPSQLLGAPVVVTRLLGEPVMKGQDVPVLPQDELFIFCADMLYIFDHLWGMSITYNDFHPRQVGRLFPDKTSDYCFYLFDFGAASRFDEDIVLPINFHFGSQSSLTSATTSPLADLESLIYVICAFAGHELPWAGAAEECDAFTCITQRVEMLVSPETAAPLRGLPDMLRQFSIAALKAVDRGVTSWGWLRGWGQALRQEGLARKRHNACHKHASQAAGAKKATFGAGPHKLQILQVM